MNFRELLILAKANHPQAMETLLSMYRPLLMKEAVVNGTFDEDLYQELCIVFSALCPEFPGIETGKKSKKKGGAARRPLSSPLEAAPAYLPPAIVHYAAFSMRSLIRTSTSSFPDRVPVRTRCV